MHRYRSRTLACAALAAVLAVSLLPSASAQSDRPPGVRGGAPACPDDVAVDATSDGNLLTWNYHLAPGNRDFLPPPESEFRIYRAPAGTVDEATVESPSDDARFTHLATVDADTTEEFLDTDIEAGASYAYVVTFYDGVESEDCDVVEGTAIPFFGAPVVAALAVAGSAGAYALYRRRS